MIASYPQEKLFLTQNLAYRLPGVIAPTSIRVDVLESEALDAHFALVSSRSRGRALSFVIRQHLLEFVGQHVRARAGAGAAEQIKGKEHGGGFHSNTPLRLAATRSGALRCASRLTDRLLRERGCFIDGCTA